MEILKAASERRISINDRMEMAVIERISQSHHGQFSSTFRRAASRPAHLGKSSPSVSINFFMAGVSTRPLR